MNKLFLSKLIINYNKRRGMCKRRPLSNFYVMDISMLYFFLCDNFPLHYALCSLFSIHERKTAIYSLTSFTNNLWDFIVFFCVILINCTKVVWIFAKVYFIAWFKSRYYIEDWGCTLKMYIYCFLYSKVYKFKV